ncbi:hypothetical protein CHCC20335_1060 [Bacillus paralicheniformis]|nr:hypothetical protein CHCC20335_1060 [Bacillus paralicheniformis]
MQNGCSMTAEHDTIQLFDDFRTMREIVYNINEKAPYIL